MLNPKALEKALGMSQKSLYAGGLVNVVLETGSAGCFGWHFQSWFVAAGTLCALVAITRSFGMAVLAKTTIELAMLKSDSQP